MAKIYHGAGHDDTTSPAQEMMLERFSIMWGVTAEHYFLVHDQHPIRHVNC